MYTDYFNHANKTLSFYMYVCMYVCIYVYMVHLSKFNIHN